MSGLAGFGTMFQVGDGASPETFTTVADVSDISGPSISLNAIDVTTHDSTDGWAEFVGGVIDAGEVSFDINFDPAETTHQNLRTLLTNRAVNNFRIVFPTSPVTTWQFAGLVTSYEVNAPVDDKLSASITIKITGKPQFTVS